MEQSSLERTVHHIPASRSNVGSNKTRLHGRQRVAAYCRVSTDSEEQINSYTAQKAYYTQKIEESPDWELAGIFADKGITGTSMKKRKEFNRMITACKRGGIDLILTKSSLPFRTKYSRLPGDGTDAESQGDRGHLRKGKYQHTN